MPVDLPWEGLLYRIQSPIVGPFPQPFAIAQRTLARACAFLGALDCAPRFEGDNLDVPRETVRSRFLGNSLRELDRFLNLLLNESAALAGQAGATQGDFARQHNAANKLDAVRALWARASAKHVGPEHQRLRAIGRVRECLASCGGATHGAAVWSDLSMARDGERAPGEAEVRLRRLIPTAGDLAPICAFYRGLAQAPAGEAGPHVGS